MNNDDNVIFVIAGVIIFVLGLSAGVILTQNNYVHPLRREAIALHYAEYNTTNGNWQWIPNNVVEHR
jgi:hypothetical protein